MCIRDRYITFVLVIPITIPVLIPKRKSFSTGSNYLRKSVHKTYLGICWIPNLDKYLRIIVIPVYQILNIPFSGICIGFDPYFFSYFGFVMAVFGD